MALFLLIAVSALMVLSTIGVKSFSDKIVKNANIKEDIDTMAKGTDAKEGLIPKREATK
ncbi:hypothetical protein [Sulfurimonas sp.]|uniref:hypothetical protein n=1 Tax=Sulfurimonas sp. TaxID=2022749 RepID=UPI0025F6E948|nr:hypothetical protein [Sulfurimonas sp.]MDD5157600.1 hypothetical protein [Sulfurimonas sp.]